MTSINTEAGSLTYECQECLTTWKGTPVTGERKLINLGETAS